MQKVSFGSNRYRDNKVRRFITTRMRQHLRRHSSEVRDPGSLEKPHHVDGNLHGRDSRVPLLFPGESVALLHPVTLTRIFERRTFI